MTLFCTWYLFVFNNWFFYFLIAWSDGIRCEAAIDTMAKDCSRPREQPKGNAGKDGAKKKKDASVCCLDFSVFRGIKCNYRGKKVRNMRDKWLPSGRQNSGNGLKVVCASPDGWKSGSSRVGRLSRNLEHTSRTCIRSMDAECYSADHLSQPFSLSSMLFNSRPRKWVARTMQSFTSIPLNTRFPVNVRAYAFVIFHWS